MNACCQDEELICEIDGEINDEEIDEEIDESDDEYEYEYCENENSVRIKKCTRCEKAQIIKNFIDLRNGTETKYCIGCRKKSNVNKPSVILYNQIKKERSPCIMCGDDDPTHLEFNHIDPKLKTGLVGQVRDKVKESELCNSMCKKCHCKHTFVVEKQQGQIKEIETEKQKRRDKARKFVTNYKLNLCGCQNPNCKDIFDPENLSFYEFDHIDFRTKRYNISKMIMSGYAIETIIEELKKCILLCSYCHRLKTFSDFEVRRNYFMSLDKPLIKRRKQELKLNMDKAKEIRLLYNTTKQTQKEIAKKFNVRQEHVSEIISNQHFKDDSYVRTRILEEKNVNRITMEMATEIRRLYNIEGIPNKELKIKFGISKGHISSIISNESHYDENYVRTRFTDEKYKNKNTKEIANEIRNLYNNEGLSSRDLQIKYNLSKTTVSQILDNKLFYDEKYKRTKQAKKPFSKEVVSQIRKEYNESKISCKDLGLKYGVHSQTISSIINNKTFKDPEYIKTR